jgi:hypothetical protein
MDPINSHTTIIGPYSPEVTDAMVDRELDAWERAADLGDYRIVQVILALVPDQGLSTATVTVRYRSLREQEVMS